MNAALTRPAITFAQVSAGYGYRKILDKISFEIRMGEFVYLVGRTGIGKSTILKMIYADHLPQEGEIVVGDFSVHNISREKIPFLRRKLGIVFQDFQLLPDRSVYDNIQFALKATGWKDNARIKQRITELLVRVGMSGKMQAHPHQLSGGEQQRVAIARALINDPMVLIADEPTGNLDPQASDHIMDILKKINLSGTAVLMATHEYAIIRKYPSRVIEVIPGGIVAHSQAESFLRHPFQY
ncbi:MAG: ATP-binding cassette domain-containing protein [Bacteroidetes bacterium]|nr:MAG: ATP-binding cassette domain-containing protein [Bacteroidota bacterium]